MRTIWLAPLALATLAACADVVDFRGGGGDARIAGPDADAMPDTAVAPMPTPQPTVLTAKERLVASIESNGCLLTPQNVGAVLNEATIGQSELMTLAPELEAEGRVSIDGGNIRVMTNNCI